MNALIRDKCPSCDHRFGFRGAAFRTPDKNSGARKPQYYCRACEVELDRIVSPLERAVTTFGFATLGIASLISLWSQVTLSEVLDREWHAGLYALSVIGIGISIYYGFTRQHYFLKQ